MNNMCIQAPVAYSYSDYIYEILHNTLATYFSHATKQEFRIWSNTGFENHTGKILYSAQTFHSTHIPFSYAWAIE